MKLKHGKKYETEDGVVYRVRDMNDGYFDESDDAINLWYPDGDGIGNPDLIRRHYTKPKPAHKLDLKPGDVVKLVAWEDGSNARVGDNIVYDGLPREPKGERALFRVVSRVSWTKQPS